jgi:hypothetical protein
MKKNFKKSKIIVPALALITATTAASVTGTVAWFTASRAITVNAGNFVATKLESNLNLTLTQGVGTTATGTNVTVNGNITHGSYAATKLNDKGSAEGHLYVANLNDDGSSVTSYTDLGTEATAVTQTASTTDNKWLARAADTTNSTPNIWYGVSWKMSFTLSTATTNQTDYVLFDVAGSNFGTNSGTTTYPGFRIAFMTASKILVVGGDDDTTHTNSTSATAEYVSSDTGKNYVAISDTTSKLNDDDSALATSCLSLGTVGYGTDNKLEITCVAWYEGNDAYVAQKYGETEITMSSIAASLNFYTRYKRA